MQLVADTNIIVASLLRKGDTRNLLFSKKFELFSPDHLILEILNHKEEFKQKGSMDEKEFQLALSLEVENLTIIPVEEYASFKQRALKLCPKGHEKDWPFIALALSKNISLWSQDKALKKQSKVKVYSTHELMKKLV